MPVKFLTWIMAALAAAALLAGCINDMPAEDFPEDVEKPAESIFVRLHIGINNNISRADGSTDGSGTSAEEQHNTEGLDDGSSQEQAINSVDIYVCDAGNGELLDYVPLSSEEVSGVQNPEGVKIPIFVEEGRKIHIYAAANLPDNLRAAFVKGQNGEQAAAKAPVQNYQDVINYFVPGSNGFQETLQRTADNRMSGDESYIPMTGLFETDTNPTSEIIITKDMTAASPLAITAKLSRIVAKVHVLATVEDIPNIDVKYIPTKGSAPEAAPATGTEYDPNRYAGWLGWIRLNNVRYMPNGTNKSTYIFQQKNNATKTLPLSAWKDTNMDLMPYVARINDNDIEFNKDACLTEFAYYDGENLHTANVDNTIMAYAEEYSLTKLDNTKEETYTGNDRYIRGMYCLENYFDTPAQADDFAATPNVNPAITHVSVAAKLTPRVIIILPKYKELMDNLVANFKNTPERFYTDYECTPEDFGRADVDEWNRINEDTDYQQYLDPNNATFVYRSFRTFKAKNETDAAYILKWSLLANELWSTGADDFVNDKYSYGTFYVYDRSFDQIFDVINNDLINGHRYLFLTAGVAKNPGDNITIKTNSVIHPGGWCYYYTYIDNNHKATQGKTPYHSSQVTRNTYYLLNITNFGSPGGSISDPEFIKVNTQAVAWDYDGQGEIVLH